jgi:hypothetical protein
MAARRCAGENVSAVTVRVNYCRPDAFHQSAKTTVFADVPPTANGHACDGNTKCVQLVNEWVTLGIARRHDSRDVNVPNAPARRQHRHHLLESPFGGRCQYMQDTHSRTPDHRYGWDA